MKYCKYIILYLDISILWNFTAYFYLNYISEVTVVLYTLIKIVSLKYILLIKLNIFCWLSKIKFIDYSANNIWIA